MLYISRINIENRMLKKYSLKALQKAINHALALDEFMPAKIAAFQGKVLEIIVIPLGVNFYIRFEQEELQLLDNYNGQPDTIVIVVHSA